MLRVKKALNRKHGNIPVYHKSHLAKPRYHASAEPQTCLEAYAEAQCPGKAVKPVIHGLRAESRQANPGALHLGLASEPEILAEIEQARQEGQRYSGRQFQIFRSLEERNLMSQSTALAENLRIRHMQQPADYNPDDGNFGLAFEHDLINESGYAF